MSFTCRFAFHTPTHHHRQVTWKFNPDYFWLISDLDQWPVCTARDLYHMFQMFLINTVWKTRMLAICYVWYATHLMCLYLSWHDTVSFDALRLSKMLRSVKNVTESKLKNFYLEIIMDRKLIWLTLFNSDWFCFTFIEKRNIYALYKKTIKL